MTASHITRFWACLDHLEDQARQTTAIPPHIEKLARKLERDDPVFARFCRETHDPPEIRKKLARIRFKAENISLDDAVEELTRLRDGALHVETLAISRDLITGRKQNASLDEHRNTANQNKQSRADRRRSIVADLVSSSMREKGALEKWVREKLKEEHGIDASIRTIRRDLKEVGQTG